MGKSHVAGWAPESPTPAQLKELFAQVGSGRITRERLQTFLGKEQPQPFFRVEMDWQKSIQQLVYEDAKFGSVEVGVLELPARKRGPRVRYVGLLHIGRWVAFEEYENEIQRLGLRSAPIQEYLSLVAQYPHAVEHHLTVAFGSIYDDGLHRCGVQVAPGVHRSLAVIAQRPLGGWDSDVRFAVVPD